MDRNQRYKYLFSEGKIGSLCLKNRIIMPAMATNFASETGGMTEHLINYYKERARGGVGLIIIENTAVEHPLGRNGATQIRLDQDRFIPGLSRLVNEIHENGAKVAIQLNHCGGLTNRSKTEGIQPVSCSPKVCREGGEIPRELTLDEIHIIVEKFGQAALRALKAGFDAVEVHGGHGYLIAQFISPYNNQRLNGYGSSLEGRTRFPLEILKEVKKKVGTSFPVLFRISAEEFIRDGRKLEETIEIAKIVEKAGVVDALNITVATGFHISRQIEPITYPQGWRVHYSKAIKENVSIPVITVGVIREPEFADQVIQQGNADFVAIGRGLIADPWWPKKSENGQEEDICKCISCNDGCINNRRYKDLPITCSVNPNVGRESEYNSLLISEQPKRIIIIGGGPAGMEAARVARLKGHHVILFEKDNELGGQMLLASKPPGKDKIRWFIDYLSYQLKSLQIDVRLNTTVTIECLKEIQPDIIILASGAVPIIPNISGINDSNFIITAHELLKQETHLKNKNIIIIGGGLVGCETAEYLEKGGNKVTIVEMLEDIALDVNPVYREDIIERFENSSIVILKDTELVGIDRNKKHLELKNCSNRKKEKLTYDFTVLACGVQPNRDLEAIVQSECKNVYLVGDCNCPGKILDAVSSASTIARLID